MANSRILVEEPIFDAFCERLVAVAKSLKVGDPREPDTVIGPLIRGTQCAVIDGHVEDAVDKGAKLLCGAKHEAEGVLEILPEFEAGLTDIEGFSHLYVIWEFDRSEGYDLFGKPPIDDRPHGGSATRSPRRPNPIALTVVELLRREGAKLHVKGVDMLDGTSILDLKPYLSSIPEEKLRRGWIAEAEARAKNIG